MSQNDVRGNNLSPNFNSIYIEDKQCAPLMHQSIPAATIPPPPPGQCGTFLRFLLVPTAGHLQLRGSPGGQAFVNIGLLLPAICRSRRKATSFLCRVPKWTTFNTLKLIKQILYYTIVECWFSSVNQCLRISFSPYSIYCVYNEKLSAIKASVSQPFVDVFI